MATGIIVPARRLITQPQYFAPIDRSRIGGKARFVLLGGQSSELVNGVSRGGTVGTVVPTPEGFAYVLPSAGTTWATPVSQLDPYVSGSFSVFWRGVIRADTLQTLLACGTLAGWEFKTDGWSPGQIRFRLAGLFSGSGPTVGPVGVTDGTIHSVGVIYDDAAATVTFYLDGVSIGSAGWTKDTAGATSASFSVKGDATSPHKMLTVQAFAGKLSSTEMYSLSVNPWQIFKAPTRRIWVSAAAGGTAYTQSISGSLTPAGALAKRTNKPLAGSSTATGALTKRTGKGLSGSSTAAGTLSRSIAKSFAGSLTGTGQLIKQTAKAFAGSVTGSGALSTMILFTASVAGSITPSGVLSKMTQKALAGASTLTGAITKLTAKGLSASITLSGALNKLTTKAFAGSITVTGALAEAYQVLKSLAGSITPTGALTLAYIGFVAGVLKMLSLLGVGQ